MKLFGENKKSHILATSFKALYTLHHTMFAMIYQLHHKINSKFSLMNDYDFRIMSFHIFYHALVHALNYCCNCGNIYKLICLVFNYHVCIMC